LLDAGAAHRNALQQRADSYPLTAKPPTDTLCVRRRFGRFCASVRPIEGQNSVLLLAHRVEKARDAHEIEDRQHMKSEDVGLVQSPRCAELPPCSPNFLAVARERTAQDDAFCTQCVQ